MPGVSLVEICMHIADFIINIKNTTWRKNLIYVIGYIEFSIFHRNLENTEYAALRIFDH